MSMHKSLAMPANSTLSVIAAPRGAIDRLIIGLAVTRLRGDSAAKQFSSKM
jgi:hypothetical protein